LEIAHARTATTAESLQPSVLYQRNVVPNDQLSSAGAKGAAGLSGFNRYGLLAVAATPQTYQRLQTFFKRYDPCEAIVGLYFSAELGYHTATHVTTGRSEGGDETLLSFRPTNNFHDSVVSLGTLAAHQLSLPIASVGMVRVAVTTEEGQHEGHRFVVPSGNDDFAGRLVTAQL